MIAALFCSVSTAPLFATPVAATSSLSSKLPEANTTLPPVLEIVPRALPWPVSVPMLAPLAPVKVRSCADTFWMSPAITPLLAIGPSMPEL